MITMNKEEITLDDILWQLEKHPIDGDYVFGCKEVKIIYDSIIKLKQENKQLKERIDKAIEYNKKSIHSQTLYKILKED